MFIYDKFLTALKNQGFFSRGIYKLLWKLFCIAIFYRDTFEVTARYEITFKWINSILF